MWLNGVPIDPSTLLGDGELVPGLRRRQLPGVRQGHGQAGHRHDRPAGAWSTTWPSSPTPVRPAAAGADEAARCGRELPGRRPGDVRGRRHGGVRPSSLALTTAGDPKDTEVVVSSAPRLGHVPGRQHHPAALPASTRPARRRSSVTLPAGLPDGTAELHLIGATTGTDVIVPIRPTTGCRTARSRPTDVSVPMGLAASVEVTVTPADAEGTVSVLNGAHGPRFGDPRGRFGHGRHPGGPDPAVGVHELT